MKWYELGKYLAAFGHHNPPADKYHHTKYKGRDITVVPADFNYTWPGRFSPRLHQRETFRFLCSYSKCFCLDGMGTGKTLSALWAMDHLMNLGRVRRVLIVCPLSLCEHVWGREIFQTLPHRKHVWCKGDRKTKQKLLADTRYDICIINPDSLHLIKQLPEIDLIIVDEFTKFKNSKSRRYKALKHISTGISLWLLSGTPTPQSPLDAYGPIRLIRTDYISFLQWRDWTMKQISKFRWDARPQAENIIAKYMQPAIRHRRRDCIDMPDVQVIDLPTDLTPEQEKYIKSFKEEAVAAFEEERVITAPTAAAVLSKCLQVIGGGVYGEDEEGRYIQAVKADPYYEAVESVVEQADTPVLIFLPFRSVAQATYDYLRKHKYKVGLVTGDTKEADRGALFDRVQRDDINALVAVAGTMSHGLTLTKARYVLWPLPPYSYEEYDQSNGRVIREGQRNDVVVYHLVSCKLAADLFKRLQTKEKLQQTVLKLLENNS